MEINRPLLRKKAWNALKGIYWFMFIICLVAMLIGVSGGGISFNSDMATDVVEGNYTAEDISDYIRSVTHFPEAIEMIAGEIGFSRADLFVFAMAMLGLMLAMWIFDIILRIFVIGPLMVGFAKLKIAAVVEREKNFGHAVFGFKNSYLSNVKTMFLRGLYVFLWQLPMLVLLYVIFAFTIIVFYRSDAGVPDAAVGLAGLMLLVMIGLTVVSLWKEYQYLLVPYIVAENPGMRAREAIRLSGEMMQGFKWQAFVLWLSFIGWYFLGALCCGIGVLFVLPYYHATETLLYEELKAHYRGNVIETAVVPEANE
ncbi:MAG: DUF975 family protein [Oscillospiraceae bacterium]|nr:DUF975 family protein [Oscillospiraceae bacterium]